MIRHNLMGPLAVSFIAIGIAVATAGRSHADTLANPSVYTIDGDTIIVNGEHIRLNGIDAPEMPGHCRPGRDCAPGDPIASRLSLQAVMTHRPIVITRFKLDRYGRTVADVKAGPLDASCWQLNLGYAIYKPRWDERGFLGRVC